MENKTIVEQIELAAGELCDSYCKYPEQYPNTDKGFDDLASERCCSCPLNKLI